MKLYKYKPAIDLDHCLDIFQQERLYCADWSTLNDPMEGLFFYGSIEIDQEERNQRLESIVSGKQALKVCSLSKTITNPLLWAHYADGFRGIAIELELGSEGRLVKVDYLQRPLEVILDSDFIPADMAWMLLSSKLKPWSYEKEYRILSSDTFFPVPGAVKRVIFGLRTEPATRSLIVGECDRLGIPHHDSALSNLGKIEVLPKAYNRRNPRQNNQSGRIEETAEIQL